MLARCKINIYSKFWDGAFFQSNFCFFSKLTWKIELIYALLIRCKFMCCSQHLTNYLLSLQNILFFDWRRASYVILLIYMLNWNSLVYASPASDVSRLSFWKTERPPRMHIPIDFNNENFSSDPCDWYIVAGFSFLANHSCYMWIKFPAFMAHFFCRWRYQRCKTSMLNLKNSFVTSFLFMFFVDFIRLGEFYVCISFGIWGENLYL